MAFGNDSVSTESKARWQSSHRIQVLRFKRSVTLRTIFDTRLLRGLALGSYENSATFPARNEAGRQCVKPWRENESALSHNTRSLSRFIHSALARAYLFDYQ